MHALFFDTKAGLPQLLSIAFEQPWRNTSSFSILVGYSIALDTRHIVGKKLSTFVLKFSQIGLRVSIDIPNWNQGAPLATKLANLTTIQNVKRSD